MGVSQKLQDLIAEVAVLEQENSGLRQQLEECQGNLVQCQEDLNDCQHPPSPVDCVKAWGEPVRVSEGPCVSGKRTVTWTRTEVIVTPPQNGGNCEPVQTETFTTEEDCAVAPVLLPAKALFVMGFNYTQGGDDVLDITKRKPQIPWNTFPAGQPPLTIAASSQGQPVHNGWGFRLLPIWGAFNRLYNVLPNLFDVNGNPEIWQTLPEWQANPDAIIQVLESDWGFSVRPSPRIPYPTRGGLRGDSMLHPYIAYHGHTRRRRDGTLNTGVHLPFYVGVAENGQTVFLMRDGEVILKQKLPLASGSHCDDFTYYDPDRIIFFYPDAKAGKLMRVDRTSEPWSVGVLADNLGYLASVRNVAPTTKIYCANRAGDIIEVDGATGEKRFVVNIPKAFWVDYDSQGRLIVATLGMGIFRIDLSTSAVMQITPPSSDQQWVMVDVDRNGTSGPVDDMLLGGYTASANKGLFRVTPTNQQSFAIDGGWGYSAAMHPARWTQDPGWVHYPWTNAFHPDDGGFLAQGGGNQQPVFFGRIVPGDFPEGYPYDDTLNNVGVEMFGIGGRYPTDAGRAPSFTCQISLQGGGSFWSYDWLAEQSFDDQFAFIKAGGIGSTPRLWLTKQDVKPLLYRACANSQRHLREGRTFIDALFAWCAA